MIRTLLLATALAFAQSPVDLYVFEEYQSWVARQPAETQKSADILDLYKAHLLDRGGDSVDAETQIRTIRKLLAEEGESTPDPLGDWLAKHKPGAALVIGSPRQAVRLRQAGWSVTEASQFPKSGRRWDLVIAPNPAIPAHKKALRPGGLLIHH